MNYYLLSTIDNHDTIITESLQLLISTLNLDLFPIIKFIRSYSNPFWLHTNSTLLPLNYQPIPNDHLNDFIQDLLNNIKKPNILAIPKIENTLTKFTKPHRILSDAEIKIIIDALDFSLRMLLGQLQEIPNIINFNSTDFDPNSLNDITFHIKCMLFKDLTQYASYGIYNHDTPIIPRITYEMVQVLRHELWQHDQNKSNTVAASPVNHESNFPLIKIQPVLLVPRNGAQ